MREIVFDTETTGMDPTKGDRIIEIGMIEVHDGIATGSALHFYINPEREISSGAQAVHGITLQQLQKERTFMEVAPEILDFIGDAILIAHNADFDMKFLNFQLQEAGFASIPPARVKDTLKMARQKFPGSPASLDALCKRFNVDLSARTLHGARLDAELLAQVYLELIGGRQRDLMAASAAANDSESKNTVTDDNGDSALNYKRESRAARVFDIPEDEEKAHQEFIKTIPHALWSAPDSN